MAIPLEYVGIDIAVRIDGAVYNVQHCRVRIHGDMGDLTSSEDLSKRRKLTVPDAEVTLTKASFNPSQNPFIMPIDMNLGSQHTVQIYPGGIGGVTDPYTFSGLAVDDIDHDGDANALQPITVHLVQADGGSPDDWPAI